jgi:hypothetical protein
MRAAVIGHTRGFSTEMLSASRIDPVRLGARWYCRRGEEVSFGGSEGTAVVRAGLSPRERRRARHGIYLSSPPDTSRATICRKAVPDQHDDEQERQAAAGEQYLHSPGPLPTVRSHNNMMTHLHQRVGQASEPAATRRHAGAHAPGRGAAMVRTGRCEFWLPCYVLTCLAKPRWCASLWSRHGLSGTNERATFTRSWGAMVVLSRRICVPSRSRSTLQRRYPMLSSVPTMKSST